MQGLLPVSEARHYYCSTSRRTREGSSCPGTKLIPREWDSLETGTRELTGEWVVNNDVWKRLKAERRARWHAEMRRKAHTHAGPSRLRYDSGRYDSTRGETPQARVFSSLPTPIYGRTPASGPMPLPGGPGPDALGDMPDPEVEGVPPSRRERVIYYVHGGAYYVGNAATHRLITIGVSKACNARVFGTSLARRDRAPRNHANCSYHISSCARGSVPPSPARCFARIPPAPRSASCYSAREHRHHG